MYRCLKSVIWGLIFFVFVYAEAVADSCLLDPVKLKNTEKPSVFPPQILDPIIPEPSDEEQYMLELVNDARKDPASAGYR